MVQVLTMQILGQVIAVAFDMVPPGWMRCDGQRLMLSHHGALFSLLGWDYGGDRQTYFCLPNLNGRVIVGTGQGLGLTRREPGDQGGSDTVVLSSDEIPPHRHRIMASSAAASSPLPGPDRVLASPQNRLLYGERGRKADLSSQGIEPAGYDAEGHENRQPFLALNYLICISGHLPDWEGQ